MNYPFIEPLPPDENKKIQDFFDRCTDLIKERASTYAPPAISLGKIAVYWSEYIGAEIRPYDAAIMMALLKIARLSQGHHQDSLEDAAAYLSIANLVKEDDKNASDCDKKQSL